MRIRMFVFAALLGLPLIVADAYANDDASSSETIQKGIDGEDCFYCGEWKPIKKSPSLPHLPGEKFAAQNLTVSLPGCGATGVIRIFSPSEARDISNHVALDFLNSSRLANANKRVLLITDSEVGCKRPLQNIPAGTLVAISINERSNAIRERDVLIVSIFSPSLYEISHTLPSALSGEELRQIKRTLHPKEVVSWDLIHSDFNHCDGGDDLSAVICSNTNLYEADGLLNEEWRSLRGVLADIQVKKAIAIQQRWLKNAKKKCLWNNEEEWNGRWVHAFETNCEAELFEKRALQFKEYRECIEASNQNCKTLSESIQ